MPLIAVKPNADGSLPLNPTEAQPLLVDPATGRLLVDTEANLTADLSDIEAKQDVTNAILTTTAADTAAIKTQLATGTVAVTGGGGGGGASAQYNATLPTYTSGATSSLQTDVNGRLIIADQISGGAKTQIVNGANTLAVDSTGAVTVNNAASATYTNTVTGAISGGTIFLGPIDCAQFRQIMIQAPSMGTGMQFIPEISLDGTNYLTVGFYHIQSGTIITGAFSSGSYLGNTFICPLYGAKFWRLRVSTGASAGTTTVVAYATQTANLIPTSSTVVTGATSVSTPTPTATLGFGLYHTLISAASTNATSVKTAVGVIGTLLLSNNTASLKWFRIFNKASAPTVGTDTPVINIPIQPNSTLDVSSSFGGLRLTTGIAYAITGGTASAAVTDSTAVAAGDVTVNLTYA